MNKRESIYFCSEHTYKIVSDFMKITVLQTDIRWSKPSYNATIVEEMISSSQGSDLYVLPEMWSTGFITQPDDIAEMDDNNFDSLKWMTRIAHEYHAAISGSISIKDGNKNFNRHYFVCPEGNKYEYDKHHLFKYGGEDRYYSSGHQRTIAEYDGMRFLLLTCYDLRFPVWSRYDNDYDAIIVVANWPSSRQNAWQILTRARAIENQCYVIGVNRVGKDKYTTYSGGSCVIDPRGDTLARCAYSKPGAATTAISVDNLKKSRNKFKVLEDRDTFEFNNDL